MSEEHIAALAQRIAADANLRDRFAAIADEAAFDALCAQLGYDVSMAEITDALAGDQLSDQELAGVAGGGGGSASRRSTSRQRDDFDKFMVARRQVDDMMDWAARTR